MKKQYLFIICFLMSFSAVMAAGSVSHITGKIVDVRAAEEDMKGPVSVFEEIDQEPGIKAFDEDLPQARARYSRQAALTGSKYQRADHKETRVDSVRARIDHYKNMPKRVSAMLSSLTTIIKDYGETEGIKESSDKLFADLRIYSDELNREVESYTRIYNAEFDDEAVQELEEVLEGKRMFINPLKVRDGYIGLLTKLMGQMSSFEFVPSGK
jgi:hypothetical protein